MSATARLAAAALTLSLAACAGDSRQSDLGDRIALLVEGRGTPALEAGVRQFEKGEYAQSTRSLQNALRLGLNASSDRATAHKYLAFMHCAFKRLKACREHFASALEADPAMELRLAEAGHPVWGPAFRAVKARR